MSLNKQIVCISPQYWTESWFRKQQFMNRFHKNGFKIAYIEPTYSIVKKPEPHLKKYAENRFIKIRVSEIEKNLYIITPPRYLPCWSYPFMNKINFIYMSIRIIKILKRIGFKNYILWLYIPTYTVALGLYRYRKIVFDMVDDFGALKYKYKMQKIIINKCVNKLVNKSDLLIVTASTLYERYKQYAKHINIIPNGFDSKLFNKKAIYKSPYDLASIKRPVVGFIGTIFTYIDFELVKYLLMQNSSKSFVFIGGCEKEVANEWEKILMRYKNAYWLGKKAKEEIPKYVANFDICINPFIVNDVSRSVSPLKVYEYLALNKPVVSVEMESLKREKISGYIDFAKNYKEFDIMVNTLIQAKTINRKYEDMNKYSWDSLFEILFNIINK